MPSQPTTPVGIEPVVGESSKISERFPTGIAPSSSTLMNEGTWIFNSSMSGGQGLLDVNNSAPYPSGGISSIEYSPQSFDFGYVGAQAGLPGEEGVGILSGGKIGQQWTGSTRSSTDPWRSHLEGVMDLAFGISQLSRKFKSTTIQRLCEVDVETLLQQSENLQQSYWELKGCVQQLILSSGGGQRSA